MMNQRPALLLRAFLILIFVGLCVCFFPAPAQSYDTEQILSFESRIKVREDSTLIVTETIEVVSLNQEIRHGIYRDFPTRYKDRLGNNVVVGFDILGISLDGHSEQYHIKSMENGQRIYIGDPDRFVSRGKHTYTLIYETTRQLGFFEDHDELYWNVTGNGWNFSILNAAATVELPGDAVSKIKEITAYTGYQGAQDKDFEITYDLFGNPNFVTTARLAPTQGLTILVSWPKGYVQPPTPGMKIGYFIEDNHAAIYVLLCLVLIVGYYWVSWYLVGRDPKKGTIIPLFNPPQNFSPAAVRYVWKMGYDDQVFSTAVINLAVKGYLKIEETIPFGIPNPFNLGKAYLLRRTRAFKADPAPEEKSVWDDLFGTYRDVLQLTQENHAPLSNAISSLKRALSSKLEMVYFYTNQGYFWCGLLFSGGVAYLTLGFLDTGELGFLLAFVVWLVLLIVNVVFYKILKAPTLQGRKLMDQIEGFRQYLSVTEKDRLNILNPPEKTPELFEKYFPYALALDVEQKWAEQFNDVLAKAAAVSGYAPSWYSGSDWSYRNPGRFGSQLSGSFTSMIASSSHAPGSSSGGGGGGGSGGGGGGGGGGGW